MGLDRVQSCSHPIRGFLGLDPDIATGRQKVRACSSPEHQGCLVGNRDSATERSNMRKTGATVSKTGVDNRDATVANDHGHPGNN